MVRIDFDRTYQHSFRFQKTCLINTATILPRQPFLPYYIVSTQWKLILPIIIEWNE